eukprot:m.19189 g.19189  ORF g.19189 m.19189 type:complete len:201 (+) comp12365_c0_seq1:137-739(+)
MRSGVPPPAPRAFTACATAVVGLVLVVFVLESGQNGPRVDKIGDRRYARRNLPTVELDFEEDGPANLLAKVEEQKQKADIYPSDVVKKDNLVLGVADTDIKKIIETNCGRPHVWRVLTSSPETVREWSPHLIEKWPELDTGKDLIWCECNRGWACEGKYCAILNNGFWPIQRNFTGYPYHFCSDGEHLCSCVAPDTQVNV